MDRQKDSPSKFIKQCSKIYILLRFTYKIIIRCPRLFYTTLQLPNKVGKLSFSVLGWGNGWDTPYEGNTIMKKKISTLLILLMTCLTACSKPEKPSAENPVVLTMWHVYGSQTESPFNCIIDDFNNTFGKEHGITIQVVSVTSSSAIDRALSASANGEPGAEELPDLFTAYPRVVEIVGKDNLLPWDQYFSGEELDEFNRTFLSEGYFDQSLLMLPVAKSTEAFYLNQTLFDHFCKDVDISISDFQTMDGVLHAANRYYDWSEGENFMQFNDFYHYVFTGMKAAGNELILDGKLQLNDDFESVWTPLAKAAIYGGICLDDGYAASRWKTVEVISNVGSTADVLYQPHEVVYADNTTEEITAIALPYPTFHDSTGSVVYRGGGLFAVKSKVERENQAAYLFAKWLTEEEQNLNFVTKAGYLPVTEKALDTLFKNPAVVENENYHSLYKAINTMIQDYDMYSLPLYEGASETQLNFEKNMKAVLKSAHNQYRKRVEDGENPETVMNELISSALAEFRNLSIQ